MVTGKRPTVVVYDTTLRDGEQMPGVCFSKSQKVKLAQALAEAGIKWLEAGFPGVSAAETKAIRAVIEKLKVSHPKTKVLVLGRCNTEDVQAAREVGAHGILLFSPASRLHRQVKGLEMERLLQQVPEAVTLARELGLWVSYSTEDSSRADPDDLRELFQTAASAGAQRLGLTDTVGVSSPSAMGELVGLVRGWFPDLPVSVHCHNDLGLATANSLAGAAAGARWVATTIGGIGERGGNTPLEEFVMAYEQLEGGHTGLDTTKLKGLADMVAKMSGVQFQPHKPVVGSNAFAHESGLHCAAVLKEPLSYEPYDSALVGQLRRTVLGKHTGKRSLANFLQENRMESLADKDLARLLDHVKDLAERGQIIDRKVVEEWLEINVTTHDGDEQK